MCDTLVSQIMSADADAADDRMEKINVRVPSSLLEKIDEEWERRGYSSKSEAIRDALRDWVNPPVTLSEEVLEELAESRRQIEQGETLSLDEVAEKHGVDLDEA
jgi:Arc/MetJ-type ribon-helix-helix transcriptional regulator